MARDNKLAPPGDARPTGEPDAPLQQGARRLSRRALLAAAGMAGIGVGALSGPILPDRGDGPRDGVEPFYGDRQPGITTPQQSHLVFAAFDVTSERTNGLRELLVDWSRASALLMAGGGPSGPRRRDEAPSDTGEALGLFPARLTITIGLGPTVFERDGQDPHGLAARKPAALAPLPSFRGDALEPDRSSGDLCVQACADDRQIAFHAVRHLARLASGRATIRWSQTGFVPSAARSASDEAPRNLMGFKDGTNNIRVDDDEALAEQVWVGPTDQPRWLRGGTYLVARRIRMLLDVWDSTTLATQERTIGRRRDNGAPLGKHRERDSVDLRATRNSEPVIPADAHIRRASPETNGGKRLLRRSYSYADGIDADTAQLDAGLFFVSYQRDPLQFVAIQRSLANGDALLRHLSHTGSAVFACPPGAASGGYIGDTLFADL